MLEFIPNILTFTRLALTFIFLGMILYSPFAAHKSFFLDIAFVLFVITELTDVVDGKIARKLKAVSKLGRMTDPLADKVLVCGTFVCFAIIAEPRLFGFSRGILALIQWSVAGTLILREAYVTVIRHITEARGLAFPAVATGKIKGVLQAFAIGTVIIKMAHVQTAAWGYWFTTATFVLMLTFTVISGFAATRRSWWKTVAQS
ncbi:MAG: CDP-alcohol phosphatidyltransferase family protein [Phycisphaerales bacterium]|nr:MAG: CDP-alcohol phosphatidyltransferase family protein [Phycisphaerales bacterium]